MHMLDFFVGVGVGALTVVVAGYVGWWSHDRMYRDTQRRIRRAGGDR